MPNRNQYNSRIARRQQRKKKRRLFIIVPLLIIVFTAVYLALDIFKEANKVITESYENIGREKSIHRTKIPNPKNDNISILIMGIDASETRGNESNARTDTLMLATMNIEEKSVKLVSIPRDSYVYVPEVNQMTKINHAHAYGGPMAAIETVEHLFDIPVDYFVRLNFEAFMEVVEALGGITVNVPYEFWEQDSRDTPNAIHLLPGVQTLNGEEALALARTRKLDSDIERGKRQLDIIKAIASKAASFGSLLKYEEIFNAVRGNIATNMEFNEISSLIPYGLSGSNLNIDTHSLEGSHYQPGNVYYWKLDDVSLNETKRMLKQHLEISSTSYTNSNTDERIDLDNSASNES